MLSTKATGRLRPGGNKNRVRFSSSVLHSDSEDSREDEEDELSFYNSTTNKSKILNRSNKKQRLSEDNIKKLERELLVRDDDVIVKNDELGDKSGQDGEGEEGEKKIRKQRPKFETKDLMGPNGLIKLRREFPNTLSLRATVGSSKISSSGSSHKKYEKEAAYGRSLVKQYKEFAHDLFPHLAYEDLLLRIEQFGSRKEVKHYVEEMRKDSTREYLMSQSHLIFDTKATASLTKQQKLDKINQYMEDSAFVSTSTNDRDDDYIYYETQQEGEYHNDTKSSTNRSQGSNNSDVSNSKSEDARDDVKKSFENRMQELQKRKRMLEIDEGETEAVFDDDDEENKKEDEDDDEDSLSSNEKVKENKDSDNSHNEQEHSEQEEEEEESMLDTQPPLESEKGDTESIEKDDVSSTKRIVSSDEKKSTTSNDESSTKALDENDEEMEDTSSLSK